MHKFFSSKFWIIDVPKLAIKCINACKLKSDPKLAKFALTYFKTGKGQYGEHDKFLGLSAPQMREVVKEFKDLPLKDVEYVLSTEYNEQW